MSPEEQNKFIAKTRMKKINYKRGAIKRKLKIKTGEKVEPGDFIRKISINGLV